MYCYEYVIKMCALFDNGENLLLKNKKIKLHRH